MPRHVVAIIGGAVAGSEAAALCADHGIASVVIEQNPLPFGKIQDGLPRWHDKLRQKECEHIGENLTKPGVVFMPHTELGLDITLDELRKDWGVNAVLLASGAWRDRPLLPDVARFVGKGLAYQNALVYWYNHYPDEGFTGPHFDVLDRCIVVGGGLASIDVVKILNFELYKRALAARGIRVTAHQLEHDGIPHVLAAHGLTQAALGVHGATLYYRREKSAMPVAPLPDDPTPAQRDKTAQVRAKVMDKVIEKYLVHFEPNAAPISPIIEGERMVGLTFQRTRTVDGKLVHIEAERLDVRAPMVVSSIGSIPRAIPGLPMRGELVDFESGETGQLRGFDDVFGLGNVLTGKGNIKESRKNAGDVCSGVIAAYLGVGGQVTLGDAHSDARAAAEPAVRSVEARPMLPPSRLERIDACIAKHWQRAGYDGDYARYLARLRVRQHEA